MDVKDPIFLVHTHQAAGLYAEELIELPSAEEAVRCFLDLHPEAEVQRLYVYRFAHDGQPAQEFAPGEVTARQ